MGSVCCLPALEKLVLDDDVGASGKWCPLLGSVVGAGGAEKSGVTLLLGLQPVHSCQPGKHGAVGFNPGSLIRWDVVCCTSG